MTTRTVSVVLGGSVAPYTTMMRTAARTTAATAATITTTMRTASARTSASLTSMARTAQAQAARAGAAIQSLATRATTALTTMGARGGTAVRGMLAPIPGLTTRALGSLAALGTRGSAYLAGLGSRGGAAVRAALSPIPAWASRGAASIAGLAARGSASFAVLASRGSFALTTLGARGAAAARTALFPFPILAGRAWVALAMLGARGAAGLAAIRAAGATAAGVLSSAFPTASARAAAALTALSARGAAAMAVIRSAGAVAGAVISGSFAVASTAASMGMFAMGTAARTAWAAASTGARTAATAASSGWLTASSAIAAGASAAAARVSAGWTAATSRISAGWTATTAAATRAGTFVAGRWSAASAAVSSRMAAAGAAVGRTMTVAGAAAGRAAAFVGARWTAAGVATSRAMAGLRLTALTAGSYMLSAGRDGEKALKAGRTAALGLVAVFGLAAYAAANFEKSMSSVRAVTGGSAKEMDALRQAAITAGAATMYSATEAANAEAELARAGISTADIVGGALTGALNLAASGQLDLGESSVIAAQAMNAFHKSGADVAHIADVISAGAGKSATDVHDMGMAFRMAALVSNQTGLSLEQTVGTLSLFAQNALTGSDAGTSLKTMLTRLTPQSDEAADMMKKLGFSAYDAQGNFIGLSALAGVMQKSFTNLTPEARSAAMATIFGSDAVRAATILYQAGTQGIDTWVKSVDDSGYAVRVAATQTDNFSGDLERLKGSLETALIQSGSSANGVLRGMAQHLTGVVNWYGQLNPRVQQSVTIMAGVVGVAGLISTAFLLMLPRIMAIRTELTALGITAARTRTMMMGIGRMTLVLGVLEAMSWATSKLTSALKDAPPNVTKLTASLLNLAKTGSATGDSVDELDGFGDAVARIAHPDTLSRLQDVGSSLLNLGGDSDIGTLTRAKDKVNALDEALTSMVQSGASDTAATAFKKMSVEAEASGTSADKLKGMLPKYTDALTAANTQQTLAADSQKKLGDESALTATDIKDTSTAVEKLTDALKILNGVDISVGEQEIGFRQSLADLSAAVKDNGHSLDITTEAGRKVKSAYLDAAKAAMTHAEAVAEQKDSVQAGDAVLAQDIEQLRKTMSQAGFSTAAIDKLTAAYTKLPADVTTKVNALTEGALAELQAVKAKIASVPAGKTITLKAPSTEVLKALQDIGYKTTTLPNGYVKISIPVAGQKAELASLQRQIDALRGKTITLITENRTINTGQGGRGPNAQANGSVMDFYANGGMRESHVAQIAPAGAWRMWAEPETGGEAYIPLAPAKRPRSRAIAEKTVQRLGGGPIQWYANGGITYSATGAPQLHQVGDAMSRYNDLVKGLQGAWAKVSSSTVNQRKQAQALQAADLKTTAVRRDGARKVAQAEANLRRVRSGRHSASQLAAAEDKLANARAASAKATAAAAAAANKQRAVRNTANAALTASQAGVYAADAALGLAKGAKVSGFSLTGYSKMLSDSLVSTNAWRAALDKIASRGGQEVRDTLEGMGEDGYDLVTTLANASDAQFRDIVTKLKATAGVASATLADFRKQVDASSAASASFAADLQTLATRGYGDLAQALAGLGGADAAALAHQAATGSDADAAAANASVGTASQALTGEDLTNSLVLLSTLRGGVGRGYADLAAAGLDAGAVHDLVPRMLAQINALPDAYKTKFLTQWAGQSGVTAMASGGIIPGRSPIVVGGERDTEAWIPLNGSGRSQQLLGRAASALGYQLVPAGRYASSAPSTAALAREVSKELTINLYGAKQSTSEQAADLARVMSFVG